MKYWLSPVQINVAEGGFADFKVCNENGEQVVHDRVCRRA